MTDATKPAAPIPGSPEWDAAMIAKAETGGVTASHTDAAGNIETLGGAPPPAPPAPETPAAPTEGETLILGKYKTQADLEAAHKELERKLGELTAKKAGDPAPKTPEQIAAEAAAEAAKTPEQKAADAAAKAAADAAAEAAKAPAITALSDKASAELAESGKMSDETYAGFEKAGISRAQLDAYVAGQQALATVRVQTVQNEVGGADEYKAMLTWAATGLSPAEQTAFDQAVTGADDGVRMMAVKGLQARYVAENGKGGTLVRPRGNSESLTGELFKSRAEMTAAMKDARYAKDDSYRAEVSRKIANTANAGIDLWG